MPPAAAAGGGEPSISISSNVVSFSISSFPELFRCNYEIRNFSETEFETGFVNEKKIVSSPKHQMIPAVPDTGMAAGTRAADKALKALSVVSCDLRCLVSPAH